MRISGPHRANPDNLHAGEGQPFSSFRSTDILPTPPLQQWQGKDRFPSYALPPPHPPTLPLLGLFLSHPDTEGISHYTLPMETQSFVSHPPCPSGQQRELSLRAQQTHSGAIQDSCLHFVCGLYGFSFLCQLSNIVRHVLYQVVTAS